MGKRGRGRGRGGDRDRKKAKSEKAMNEILSRGGWRWQKFVQ